MKKNSMIIMFLIGIICLMGIGFAAFGTSLTINGTSSIVSTWDVEIIGITSTVKAGTSATDSVAPIFSKTSATFKTELVSPGDEMEYEISIKNKGDVDAKLDGIQQSDSQNPAIVYRFIGQEDIAEIKASETKVCKVVVSYSDDVTTQPDSNLSSLTIKLDYVQKK